MITRYGPLDPWPGETPRAVKGVDARAAVRAERSAGRTAATVAAEPPCLDYRSKSDTLVRHAVPRVYNRARVFRTGEVEIRTVLTNAHSRPPRPAYGYRFTRGVSGRGRRTIRRGVGAYTLANRCSPVMYTLTCQDEIDDAEFRAAFRNFLKWCRKYIPRAAEFYAWTVDLQARGVLHAHLLLLHKPPPKLWQRMRDLWRIKYGMGPGSFDIKVLRRASRAAGYMVRYITRHEAEDGARIGRNGEVYHRISWQGNAYGVSRGLRQLAEPLTEVALAWTVGPVLGAVNLRGCVHFFASPEDGHAALARALTAGASVPHRAEDPPPGVRSGSETGSPWRIGASA